ncbi:extracellular matrix regulator RemB [Halalkalibacter urbisdiaboli]|uniref:extracellular matrix regulator RemB n=1 Tax=Halalkalibacter urbisdiaboli TaxID=1960589 RepID=UPI000B44DE5A|nr:extracellular matrix/biofilm biosynthesis regulator RemA family protein [Halalkalibacter urbisdiaboli]
MFIHLGGDIIIRSKEIITILNHDVQEMSSVTKGFLKQEEKKKKNVTISADFIKSIVITDEAIYYSPVSSVTLNRRAQVVSDFESQLDKEQETELSES